MNQPYITGIKIPGLPNKQTKATVETQCQPRYLSNLPAKIAITISFRRYMANFF